MWKEKQKYLSLFETEYEAMAFEERVAQNSGEELPEASRRVCFEGGTDDKDFAAHYTFLIEQFEEMNNDKAQVE